MTKNRLFRTVSLLLSVLLLFGTLSTASLANYQSLTSDEWDSYWGNSEKLDAALLMSPGADESERNFSWYSPLDAGECFVKISADSDFSDSLSVAGSFVKTPQGDRSNKVTVTGLEAGTTYYYDCCTEKYGSDGTGSFTTLSDSSFSAMYMTDIHISAEKDSDALVKETAYHLDEVIGNALTKNADISLVLSGGDQASSGLRKEYEGLVASPYLDNIAFAPCVGNHDRKGIDYRYFTNNPNEDKCNLSRSYVGTDYYFVKGDALFLVMDSNSLGLTDHYSFVKDAVKANSDVKWRVMIFHHDLYGGRKPSREQENALLRLVWTPIIDEFEIDLAMMGHSHYYTVSDVIYDDAAVTPTGKNAEITDAAGTVYFVSGSINRANFYSEDIPLGEKIGFAYLPDEVETLYNILDFSENSIVISSYSLERDELFNTFTLNKTSQQGGHPEDNGEWYDGILRFIGTIASLFNNIGVFFDYLETLK